MTVSSPSYLRLSRHNVFYFRWPVPAFLHPQGQVRHVEVSLRTRNPKEALRLAKILEYHAVKINRRLIGANINMSHAEAQRALKHFFLRMLEAEKQEIDLHGSLSDEQVHDLQRGVRAIEEYLLNGSENHDMRVSDDMANKVIELVQHDMPELSLKPGTSAYDKFKQDMPLPYLNYCKELLKHNSGLHNYDFSTLTPVQAAPPPSGKPLKEAVNDFVTERMRGDEWTERTRKDREAQFSLLMEMLGDNFDITRLDAAVAVEIKKVLQELPKNRNKNPKTRGLSLADALRVENVEKLGIKTINEYLTTFQSLFGWAENHGFVTKNPFKNLNIKQKKG